MDILTEEAIEQLKSKGEPIEVPDWGGSIRVRKMSADIQDKLDQMALEEREDPDSDLTPMKIRAEILHDCITTPSFESPEAIREMPAAGVRQAFLGLLEYSGSEMTVDEAEKNSETIPPVSSDSSSPTDSDAPSESSSDE